MRFRGLGFRVVGFRGVGLRVVGFGLTRAAGAEGTVAAAGAKDNMVAQSLGQGFGTLGSGFNVQGLGFRG